MDKIEFDSLWENMSEQRDRYARVLLNFKGDVLTKDTCKLVNSFRNNKIIRHYDTLKKLINLRDSFRELNGVCEDNNKRMVKLGFLTDSLDLRVNNSYTINKLLIKEYLEFMKINSPEAYSGIFGKNTDDDDNYISLAEDIECLLTDQV